MREADKPSTCARASTIIDAQVSREGERCCKDRLDQLTSIVDTGDTNKILFEDYALIPQPQADEDGNRQRGSTESDRPRRDRHSARHPARGDAAWPLEPGQQMARCHKASHLVTSAVVFMTGNEGK